MTSLLERLRELDEKATPGPWQEDGTLWGGGRKVETDASANDGEDWITFKSRRADEDRALFIAARDALPAVVALAEAAQLVRDHYLANLPPLDLPLEGAIVTLNVALAPFVSEATP